MGVGSSAEAADYVDQPSAAGELAAAQAQAQAAAAAAHQAPVHPVHYGQHLSEFDGGVPPQHVSLPVSHGSPWSGPSAQLAPTAAEDAALGGEVPRWFGSTLFPTAPTRIRGARCVDAQPPRLGELRSGFISSAAKASAEELSGPMRPTRSGLESENAGLCASVGAARALQDALAKKVRSMREAVARGDITYGVGEDGREESFGTAHLGLQTLRMQAVSLEAELDRYRDKIRAHASVSERQRREMVTLKRDSTLQGQRASSSRKEAGEARERLRVGRQEMADLARQAKTGQLRVEMLRDAFEQEQTRVGVSLGRAESSVSDLVAATEGTRRVEMEEQTLARECVSALSEIHAAEARDELMADADCRRLRRELNLAVAELSEASPAQGLSRSPQGDVAAVAAAAAYANMQSERHAAATQLSEARRKCHGVSLIARRCISNEAELRRGLEALRAERARETKKDGESGARAPRMQLEEAAEAALSKAEAKITGIISAAQKSGLVLAAGGRPHSPAADSARQYALSFGTELDLVRSELREARAPSMPSHSSQDPDWRTDLEAAGLQRKLGKVLAAERDRYCQLLEARLRCGQVQAQEVSGTVRDSTNISMLKEQVKVLRNELNMKDAEIHRLSRSSTKAGDISEDLAPPVRGRT